MTHIFVYRVIATPVLDVHCICHIVTRKKTFLLHTRIVQSHQFQSVYFSAWLENIFLSLEELKDPNLSHTGQLGRQLSLGEAPRRSRIELRLRNIHTWSAFRSDEDDEDSDQYLNEDDDHVITDDDLSFTE